MILGLEREWAWWVGGAIFAFVAFLLLLLNKPKVGADGERWERAPRYIHALTFGVLMALIAAYWRSSGRDLEFWAWSCLAAMFFVQGLYLFRNRNKPLDKSPAAERRRAVLGAIWAGLLFLPLTWTLSLVRGGAEIEDMAWALSIGFALGGAFGLFWSFRQWTGASRIVDHE